jgi:hypothetical protein
MFQSLYKYLILNKKATVPGIGIFYMERKPARLDFADKVFVSPTLQICFDPQPSLVDKGMYTFISREQKIDESEAVRRYYIFANKLRENLIEHKSAEVPGMGVLSQNEEGQLFFKGTFPLDNYFPPAAAERVVRENTEHHILVGETRRTNTQMKEMLSDEGEPASQARDYWWVFAIALGVIGIATIVYYYLHNGSLH